MPYILLWISLVLVSLSLIFLAKWVKEGAQIYALLGLTVVELSLIMALNIL